MAETYQVKYEPKSEPFKHRALRFAFFAIQSAILWCLLSLIPWFRTSNKGMIGTVLEGLAFGILFAIVFPLGMRPFRQYELRVSDDSLTADYGYLTRTIHKGELRTVREDRRSRLRPAGLVLSKYGPLGTRMWGFIWVPRQCADYEHIRDLASEWQQASRGK
jgi:hypothetical protein